MDAVLAGSAVEVATTGTIAFDHRADQDRCALTLLPPTWTRDPWATDIEPVGVHGPRTLVAAAGPVPSAPRSGQ